MHPEEREWVEDVKQWARDFLSYDELKHEEKGEVLEILISGIPHEHWRGTGLSMGTKESPFEIYLWVDAYRERIPTYPLGWTEVDRGYVLLESHRAAIYSVLKAWRKEQEST